MTTEKLSVTARQAAPKVSAADLKAAASWLLGTVVEFVEDATVGPAVYKPRLAAFVTVSGDDLGSDDGTIIDLLDGLTARDLISLHGSAGEAAKAVNARLRAEAKAV